MRSVAERRPVPRSKDEWRARVRDALDFGDRLHEPVPQAQDLVHRVVLLVVVAAVTGLFVALFSTPGIAIMGSTLRSVANRFSGPIGSTEIPEIAQRSVVLDRKGRVIATLAKENRTYVTLKQVPEIARQAVIATEDAKFYEHHGVDLAGLVRALLFNFRSGGELHQGGSTITQQLVKKGIIETETGSFAARTLDRKIDEARRAIRLEQVRSKDQILEMYLNQTYFGNGAYGIGAAAEFYFGEPVEKLTLPQAALLAGIIQAPEDEEPIKHPKRATERRHVALQRMVDAGYITRRTAERYFKARLGARAHPLPAEQDPYFVQYIRRQILSDPKFGDTPEEREERMLAGGLRIETTLDLDLERSAGKAIDAVLDKPSDPPAALVSIEPSTGAIRAIIGGRDFAKEHYDLATQGRRQPGSTFKTMTLVAALANGLAPSLTFDTPSPFVLKNADGTPVLDDDGKPYEVNNFEREGEGFVDLRVATAHSVNTYYVQLAQRVGPDKVVDAAKKLGITSELKPYPSIALGSFAVTPLELASAYSTLANHGIHCAPFSIARIKDASGRVVESHAPACEQVIPASVAAAATDILRGVIVRGTASGNGQIGRQAAGKTGTTENHADAWFAGYTPQFATVVWMGFPKDETHPLTVHGYTKGVTGGTLPTMIWARFMKAAHRGVPVAHFDAPPSFPSAAVPDVVGRPTEEARTGLDAAGFPTIKIVTAASARPVGTVLAQDPAAGASAPAGALVTLTVSGGGAAPSPKPSPSPSPSTSPSASPSAMPSGSKKPKD